MREKNTTKQKPKYFRFYVILFSVMLSICVQWNISAMEYNCYCLSNVTGNRVIMLNKLVNTFVTNIDPLKKQPWLKALS